MKKAGGKRVIGFFVFIGIAIVIFLLYKNTTNNNSKSNENSPEIVLEDKPENKDQDSLNFNLISFENISKKEQEGSLSISIEYPKFNLEKIDTEIENFIEQDTVYFKNNTSGVENFISDNIYQIESEVYQNSDYLSIVFNIYEFTGGAHGNIRIKTLNFNKWGNLIEIGDLFLNSSNYLSVISNKSRQQLKDTFTEYDPKWIDDGTAPISQNFEDFYIKEESNLVFIFEPYTVGPWVIGTPKISIDLNESDIKNILKNE